MKTFSERLAEKMAENRHNKSSLASAVGVSHTSISRWLKGAKPTIAVLELVAHELNTTVHWLVTGNENPFPDAADSGAVAVAQKAIAYSETGIEIGANERIASTLSEIRIRLQQLHHARSPKMWDLWLKEAHSRIDEYADWIRAQLDHPNR